MRKYIVDMVDGEIQTINADTIVLSDGCLEFYCHNDCRLMCAIAAGQWNHVALVE